MVRMYALLCAKLLRQVMDSLLFLKRSNRKPAMMSMSRIRLFVKICSTCELPVLHLISGFILGQKETDMVSLFQEKLFTLGFFNERSALNPSILSWAFIRAKALPKRISELIQTSNNAYKQFKYILKMYLTFIVPKVQIHGKLHSISQNKQKNTSFSLEFSYNLYTNQLIDGHICSL